MVSQQRAVRTGKTAATGRTTPAGKAAVPKQAPPAETSGPRAPEPSRPGRPATVTAAAVLTGLVAALLLGYGVYLVIAGLGGQPVLRGRAELGGAMFLLFGLGVGWVARGLLRLEAWARTPALLTHLLVLAACYWMVQGSLYGEAVPTGLYGLAGIVLLFVPASHRVLSRDVH
jgi:hypothetical protein